MKDTIIKWYLEYLNNSLTVEQFAEYHNLSATDAHILIDMGRKLAYEAIKELTVI